MTDWIDAISARADVDPDEVRRVHGYYGIVPSPALPTPGRLLVRRVKFAGTKSVGGARTDFDFDWRLDRGPWAIITDDVNLRGKSTIIEVIRWAIRGRSSVQPDVRAWLRSFTVELEVNQRSIVVTVDLSPTSLEGTLKLADGAELGAFDSDESFEATMQSFMLTALGLQPLAFFQRDPGSETGSRQTQGWAALSEALHIHSTDALLGDVVMGGLAGRLLQMYLGLPWTTTIAAIRAAMQEIESEERQGKAPTGDATNAARTQVRLLRLDIVGHEERLAALPDPAAQLDRRSLAMAALSAADSAANSAAVVLAATEHEVDELRHALVEDERRLLDARETGQLRRFFNGVNPKVCPRCDEPVDRVRRQQEARDGTCSVCSASGSAQTVDDSALAQLGTDVDRLRSALTEAESSLTDARAAFSAAQEQREAAVAEATEAAIVPTEKERREVELAIAGLRGQLQALEQGSRSEAVSEEASVAARVLKASETEAVERASDSDRELLGALNAAVVELGHTFGFDNLEEVSLARNGTLRLTKGGVRTSFSRLTGGEQLRVKIALVVALLRIGRDQGVGRHPGLVLVDAPAGQETSDHDVRSILDALRALTDELPDMQTIIATARGALARDLLPPDRLLTPNDDGYLW